MTTTFSRRSFLQLAGTTAAAAALPTIFVPRRARAATPAFGTVRHLLVLHAKGGFRSHCTFNAVGAFRHNPFGTQPASTGTQWALGAACGSKRYSTSLGEVPAFAEVTHDVSVLACVDHDPGGRVVVDHVEGHRSASTGSPTGGTGLLSIVGAHHALYADGFSSSLLPPVEIVPTDMGLGAGVYGERRPLALLGARFGVTGGLPLVQGGFHHQARAHLDEAFLRRTSRTYQKRLRNYHLAKQNAALFSSTLTDALLDVVGTPDGSGDGVTNAQLLEVLGNHDLADIGDPVGGTSWGGDVALALRCFAKGSPFVAVTRDIYDMHDLERDAYGPRTEDLVRQLAGLHFLLPRMPHPEGGSYWDKTLVVTLSEFSRNNTFAETGFNSGNGSDHVGESPGPARNQAIAVMGGALVRPGRQLGATDEEMNAVDQVFSMRSLSATLLDVLGVDGPEHVGADPIAELFS